MAFVAANALQIVFWRSVRLALTRLGFADVDTMLEAFCALVRFGFDDVNAKARAGERLAEGLLVRCRPKGDAPAGLQGICDAIESAPAVDFRVSGLDKRGRPVIDIEENGVVAGRLRPPDNSKD